MPQYIRRPPYLTDVDQNRNQDNILTQVAPVGSVIAWAGSTALSVPQDWLLCDGSAINRLAYAMLFAVIGTTWGAGDGSTTFNLPNLADSSPVGAGGTAGAVGASIGAAAGTGAHTHTITTGNDNTDHSHTVNSHNHGGNTGSTEPPNHTHIFTSGGVSADHYHTGKTQSPNAGHGHDNTTNQFAGRPTNVSAFASAPDTNGASSDHTHSGTTAGIGAGIAHTHTIAGDTPGTGGRSAFHQHAGTTDSTGTGSTGNYSPSKVMRFIIKT